MVECDELHEFTQTAYSLAMMFIRIGGASGSLPSGHRPSAFCIGESDMDLNCFCIDTDQDGVDVLDALRHSVEHVRLGAKGVIIILLDERAAVRRVFVAGSAVRFPYKAAKAAERVCRRLVWS